jgi:Lipocalin-like domain
MTKITPDMILGSWKLVRTYTTIDGAPDILDPLGKNAVGYVHYLSDGRMAVLIAHANRPLLSGDRYSSPDAELAESARTFTGYGGTFTCGEDQVVHHLDISSFENDNLTDYVRAAGFDEAGLLTLTTPPVSTEHGQRSTCLVWERLRSL